MTLTHLSHFGLKEIGRTTDNILFSGTLAACKRMAAAHGMEVGRVEGAIVSSDGGKAIYAPAVPSAPALILYRDGGLIVKGRDDYSLVMPVEVWING